MAVDNDGGFVVAKGNYSYFMLLNIKDFEILHQQENYGYGDGSGEEGVF